MIASIEDFLSNLKEVDMLLSYAAKNSQKIDRYKLFIKTAMVMLCSHFEVFVETFISEHVDILKRCYDNDTLPQFMKDNYINDTVKVLKDLSFPSRKTKTLKAIFRLHDSVKCRMLDIDNLEIDMKYSFGKHGQEETERLFKKFGLENFVKSTSFKNSFKKINSAISIRNNIIHEGSAPTLSYKDMLDYKQSFLDFANALEKHIIENQSQYYGKIWFH